MSIPEAMAEKRIPDVLANHDLSSLNRNQISIIEALATEAYIAGHNDGSGRYNEQKLEQLRNSPEKMDTALNRLDARERSVVELTLGLGEDKQRNWSLEQIGKQLGISSREKVRQIQSVGLRKLLEED